MAGSFDPYHRWLGIAPKDQPPNHYRLLGLDALESDPTAIEHAADQRMTHLRSLQTGKHAAASQKLLNEIAAARVCLLDPQKKAAYDAQLRRQLAQQATNEVPTAEPVIPEVAPVVVQNAGRTQIGHVLRRKRTSSSGMVIGLAAAGGLLVLGLAIWLAGSGKKPPEPPAGEKSTPQPVAKAPRDPRPPAVVPAPVEPVETPQSSEPTTNPARAAAIHFHHRKRIDVAGCGTGGGWRRALDELDRDAVRAHPSGRV